MNESALEIANILEDFVCKRVEELFCRDLLKSDFKVQRKLDNSFVTNLDQEVSNIVKEFCLSNDYLRDFVLYSEEDFDQLKFPCVILDPIDGTNELIKRIPECSVSLSIMNSPSLKDKENYSLLINPFTGFKLDSLNKLYTDSHNQRGDGPLLGLVSRNEYGKGTFNNISNKEVLIKPMGSIAFKLGLLAAGACDFVVTTRPKNLWDISAGTHLCFNRKINLYIKDKIINELDKEIYDAPMLWCREQDQDKITKNLSNVFS